MWLLQIAVLLLSINEKFFQSHLRNHIPLLSERPRDTHQFLRNVIQNFTLNKKLVVILHNFRKKKKISENIHIYTYIMYTYTYIFLYLYTTRSQYHYKSMYIRKWKKYWRNTYYGEKKNSSEESLLQINLKQIWLCRNT